MNTPKIRFKGFEDDWEQRKVGEVTKELLDYDNFSSGLPLLTSSRSGLMYQSEYRGNATTENENTLFSVVPLNACTYRHMSDDSTFHLNINTLEKGLVSKEYPVFQENESNLKFIVQYINSSNSFTKFCTEQKKGGTRTRLYYKTLCEYKLMMPSIKEQNKTANFFDTLDHLITLHQRKCDETKQLKKFMLQKMFPKNGEKNPEIRFEGFTDDWEQRKLGEVVGIYDGVHQTPQYQDSGIMFLSVENITTLKSEKYISEEAFERDYKVYPQKGDILMTRIGDVGTTNVVQTTEKVAFYVSLALLKPKEINSYFLSNAMKTSVFQKGLRERTLVTAIPQKINKDEIGRVNVFITNNAEEQKKIGDYFTALDHLITLHQRKCEKLKELKKFMLQNMFV